MCGEVGVELAGDDDDDDFGGGGAGEVGGDVGERGEMGACAGGEMVGAAVDFDAADGQQRGDAVGEAFVLEEDGVAAEQGQFGGHGAAAIAGADDGVARH